MAEDYCKGWQGCEGDFFLEYYSSVAECANERAEDVASYASDYDDPECYDAILDYYACVNAARTGCDPVDRFTYSETKREQCERAINEACPDFGY